jgi:hypothetical protein
MELVFCDNFQNPFWLTSGVGDFQSLILPRLEIAGPDMENLE